MITEAEIKSIVYKYVKQSSLADAVNGTVTKRKRPVNSTKEDIVIAVLASNCAQFQEFFINVNIYVPYNTINHEEDSARVEELSIIAANYFREMVSCGEHNYNGYDLLLRLDTQRIEDLSDIGFTLINNKLLIINN